jgi:hypothetical protein
MPAVGRRHFHGKQGVIMKLRLGVILAAAFILTFSAAPARADVVLSPYVGGLFGGDLPNSKADYGFNAAFMNEGIFGAEIGFNYAPRFVPATFTTPAVTQSSLMGNLIIGIPIGGDSGASVRPYITGGAGLFRTATKGSDLFDRIHSNDFAVNVGGGLMGFFSDHVGLRGDVRYFRTLRNEAAGSGLDFDFGDLDFWRGSVGAAFRF